MVLMDVTRNVIRASAKCDRTSPSSTRSVGWTSPSPRSTLVPPSPWLLATSPSRLEGVHRRERNGAKLPGKSVSRLSLRSQRTLRGAATVMSGSSVTSTSSASSPGSASRSARGHPLTPKRCPGISGPTGARPDLPPAPLTTGPEPASGPVVRLRLSPARGRHRATA